MKALKPVAVSGLIFIYQIYVGYDFSAVMMWTQLTSNVWK